MRAVAALVLSLATAGEGIAQESELILVRPGDAGPAADLIAYETIIGGETLPTAGDFGFLQESEDGYAIRGLRTRVTDAGLEVLECEGGLAPADLDGVFEGAYACEGEIPVPLSYQPANGKLLPNLLDPNGVWEEEGFFVSALMSIKVLPARAYALPADAVRPLVEEVPAALGGLVGRVAPPPVQARVPCGDGGVALFFPKAGLPACADADIFD